MRFAGSTLGLALLALGCSDGDPGSESLDATAKSGPATWCTTGSNGKPKGSGCAAEAKVASRFEALRGDSVALATFLAAMPKGGDLHSHLSGAASTETLIHLASADGLCVDGKSLVAGKCGPGAKPIAGVAPADLLRAWSMEGFEGSTKEGHDHFFDAFVKFRAVTLNHSAEMLADVTHRAAERHVRYLELMVSLGVSTGGKLGTAHLPVAGAWDAATLDAERTEIVADPKFTQNVDAALDQVDQLFDGRAKLQRCGSPDADPGCGVEVRLLVQVARDATRESVFGQLVHAFELASRDPRVVGLNVALAEDSANSLANYEDDMTAIDVLRPHYDANKVHVALHAGELVPAVLPQTPDGQKHLTFHIRRAVEIGHAERIGHGIDVATEEEDGATAADLLTEMRDRHVLVEVCRSSNDYILGVDGPSHPMARYLEAGVPVAIATDDEGVSRSDLSEELARAVVDHELGWREIKAMARRSLEHAFLPGASLWNTSDTTVLAGACAKSATVKTCKDLLAASERAKLQLELEEQLVAFEKRVLE